MFSASNNFLWLAYARTSVTYKKMPTTTTMAMMAPTVGNPSIVTYCEGNDYV
jgi:hypothetical protein